MKWQEESSEYSIKNSRRGRVTLRRSTWLVFPLLCCGVGWRALTPRAEGRTAAQGAASKQTHVYRTVQNHPIRLDVYLSQGKGQKPVLLWIHGGALIFGHRGTINQQQLNQYLGAGFAVVSIDYRLAPETKLPGILADVDAAYSWIRKEGANMYSFDRDRIAVIGHSAGGYLTLTSGYRFHPRPRALISFYGYGDIVGEWYTRASPVYLKEPAVSVEAARAAVGNKPISEALSEESRWPFYLYCRQNGLWPQEVAGLDPAREPGSFVPFCPLKNVGKDYPPTILLHGDKDEDVPFEQSLWMSQELKRQGILHEFIVIKNGEHGFDGKMDDPQVQAAFKRIFDFLRKQLGRPSAQNGRSN